MKIERDLGFLDTLPDIRRVPEVRRRTTDESPGVEAPNRALLDLAVESYEKELGVARLCRLARLTLRDAAKEPAIDRYEQAAKRRADAVRGLADLLARNGEVGSVNLSRSAARLRVAAMQEAVQIGIDAEDPGLAERVALESVAAMRVLARHSFRLLLSEAGKMDLAAALVSSPASEP